MSLPLWRAVIRWPDLKAFRGEEERQPPGAVSAPRPASIQPCTVPKMKTLECGLCYHRKNLYAIIINQPSQASAPTPASCASQMGFIWVSVVLPQLRHALIATPFPSHAGVCDYNTPLRPLVGCPSFLNERSVFSPRLPPSLPHRLWLWGLP